MEWLPFASLLAFGSLEWGGGMDFQLSRVLGLGVVLAVLVQGIGFFLYDSSWDSENEPLQTLEEQDGELRYAERDTAEAIFWSVDGGVLLDALEGVGDPNDPMRGFQFGLDSDLTLSSHPTIERQPMPRCSVLRTVDRFPRHQPQAVSR